MEFNPRTPIILNNQFLYLYRKLVDRLENMKRNSNVSNNSSHNRCALCGDYFYILRYSPNQCGFCQKVIDEN